MLLRSPKNLHYPITVTELLKRPSDNVARLEPLFAYSYKSLVIEGDEYGDERQVEKTFPTRFESEAEGVVQRWKITKGAVIAGPDVDLVEIEEPCRHEQQFGGLCAICGKDMTQVSYNTSAPDAERATINMVHGNTALLVSASEANRVEEEAKRRLLSFRKLSLVVDLDQTIIHATVDPTVAEWQKDPTNPNYDAVKDVRAFQLLDEGPGRGCWYYIKLRPGLESFLRDISKLYELHIYTMGTRAYAANIAKIVDPDRKIFGDRILSRDESGSMTAKSLQRLFPVDTKMVVIIDDRGDVWNWSDNLIKVTPYDFFVGIGDINSSFLPGRTELFDRPSFPEPAPPPAEDSIQGADDHATANGEDVPTDVQMADGETLGDATQSSSDSQPPEETKAEPPSEPAQPESSTNVSANGTPAAHALTALEQIVSMGAGGNAALLQQQAVQQDETLSAQLTDRPLLQKQKLLDEAEGKALEQQQQLREQEGQFEVDGTPASTSSSEQSAPAATAYRHNLLQDDDGELQHLEQALRRIHKAFFDDYDRKFAGSQGGRIAELRGERSSSRRRPHEDLLIVPDIKDIMPPMKLKVLDGLTLCFTGVVPLGINIYYSDLGRWAMSFGARISDTVTSRTTHVIARKDRRTAKVRAAARSAAYIVTTAWLSECFSQWTKVDEGPYLIHSDVHRDPAIDTSAFDALVDEQDLTLSEEEDEGEGGTQLTDGDDDDNNASSARSHTGDAAAAATATGSLRIRMADVMPSRPPDDDSPIDDLEDTDWQEMWAEFDELPSDDGDGDSSVGDGSDNDNDNDDEDSDASQQIAPSTSTGKRKRKRPTDSVSTISTDVDEPAAAAAVAEDGADGDDSDASTARALRSPNKASSAGGSSKLQRRKKRALARTSSLQDVVSVGTAAAADAGAESDVGGEEAGNDDVEEEEDDGFGAEFEADLEAQLMEDSDDDGGGGGGGGGA